MKISKGKIVEATRNEMYEYYLSRGWDDVMSFPAFLDGCKENGTKITARTEKPRS